MSHEQMLHGQMSLWHLESVQDDLRNLSLKFGQIGSETAEILLKLSLRLWVGVVVGVQSHFHIKPDLGYVRLNWVWVGDLTILNPLDQMRNICKRNILIQGLEVGEIIPFPVWAETTVFSQSLDPKQITLFTVESTTTTIQPPPTHHRKLFTEFKAYYK